jgi:hypothetical protein
MTFFRYVDAPKKTNIALQCRILCFYLTVNRIITVLKIYRVFIKEW